LSKEDKDALVKAAKKQKNKVKVASELMAGGKEIVFDGKNAKEVKKFLNKHGYDLNIESNGKLTVGDDETIIFKEDTLLVNGGKLSIKKPSYGGGAAKLVKVAQELTAVASHPENAYKKMEMVFKEFKEILKEADKLSEERDIEYEPIKWSIISIQQLLDAIIKNVGSETEDSDRQSYALERMSDSIRKHVK